MWICCLWYILIFVSFDCLTIVKTVVHFVVKTGLSVGILSDCSACVVFLW